MRLVEFRVKNFRSVNDSGPIDVRNQTALVGRNESGKTNLLLAIQSLNPTGGIQSLSDVKDFPRDRAVSEFDENIKVVESTWELTNEERSELAELYPRAKDVAKVTISRPYKPVRLIGFEGLAASALDAAEIRSDVENFSSMLSTAAREAAPDVQSAIASAVQSMSNAILSNISPSSMWANEAASAIASLRNDLSAREFPLSASVDALLSSLEGRIKQVTDDQASNARAQQWVVSRLPIFMYLSDYPEFDGHQNVAHYLARLADPNSADPRQKEADANFSRLLKVAGLDAATLQKLLNEDHEKRQQMANRSGAVVTRKIRELWTDRPLKIRFNLDADYFDTLVSDPNSLYDVEVNLDERSRGLRWFFSFYVTFAADTAGGPAENAILLLDEPGLHLHAIAQRNLLDLFKRDFRNQIIYTTHSPFMIPTDDLASVRTVNISPEMGTTVTNDPTGDYRTLFPLQAALGYDLTQTLFVGSKNVVVEGVSDFWYLSAASDYLSETGSGLSREITISPAGGAQKVSYMVALLTSQNLHVIVLLDDEKQARSTAEEIVKAKLIRDESVIFVSDGLQRTVEGGADVEDLLDPDIYDELVSESYSKELAGKKLQLNAKIPRIVKRYEEAFTAVGLDFIKTRPAKLFLRKIAEAPERVMSATTCERFERLFGEVSRRMTNEVKSNRAPFR